VQIGILGGLALLGFNVSQGALDWTQGFDGPVPISGVFPFAGPTSLASLLLWLLFFILGSVLVVKRPSGKVLTSMVGVCSGLVLVGSLLPVLHDGLSRSNSWLSQQTASLRGQRCGLASMAVVTRSFPLPPFLGDDLSAVTQTRSDLAFPLAPRGLTAYESWGARAAATPWFETVPGQDLQGWLTTSGAAVAAEVQFNGAFGQSIARVPVRRQASDVWIRWTSQAPPGSKYVRISWTSAGEQVSATEPLRVIESTPITALSANAVWNNPQAYFQAACFEPVDISSGGVPALDLSFGIPQWMGGARAKISKPVELACPSRNDALATNVCAYGYPGQPLEKRSSPS
jgi:hypothetical protein